jgi:hypothetical protein
MKAAICLAGALMATIVDPAKEPRHEEIMTLQPMPIQKACQEICPDAYYRIFRIVEHQKVKPFTYTVTFFSVGPGTRWRKVGDDWVAELPQFDVELAADGHIIEEGAHDISGSAVPKAVLAGYRKWNPKGLTGMWVRWGVMQPKNEKRTFMVMVVFNQVDEAHAAFLEDGSLVKEKSSATPTEPERKPRRS